MDSSKRWADCSSDESEDDHYVSSSFTTTTSDQPNDNSARNNSREDEINIDNTQSFQNVKKHSFPSQQKSRINPSHAKSNKKEPSSSLSSSNRKNTSKPNVTLLKNSSSRKQKQQGGGGGNKNKNKSTQSGVKGNASFISSTESSSAIPHIDDDVLKAKANDWMANRRKKQQQHNSNENTFRKQEQQQQISPNSELKKKDKLTQLEQRLSGSSTKASDKDIALQGRPKLQLQKRTIPLPQQSQQVQNNEATTITQAPSPASITTASTRHPSTSLMAALERKKPSSPTPASSPTECNHTHMHNSTTKHTKHAHKSQQSSSNTSTVMATKKSSPVTVTNPPHFNKKKTVQTHTSKVNADGSVTVVFTKTINKPKQQKDNAHEEQSLHNGTKPNASKRESHNFSKKTYSSGRNNKHTGRGGSGSGRGRGGRSSRGGGHYSKPSK